MYSIIKADYLQRTRSYAFIITLAVTAFVAYSFVPPVNASYTTLNVMGYKGAYNSAWVGYVTAIMTSVMLSFYGFLLVNNSIKKDIETEVGFIIASSPISNFRYLLSKQLSNFLVLFTITCCIFLISMLMFFVRGKDYPFIFTDFIGPYLFFALPAMFLVAAIAVVAEVFLGKKSILQFIIYFFICGAVMAGINKQAANSRTSLFDPFGLSIMTNSVKNQINSEFKEDIKQVSFGFIFNKQKTFKTFTWEGVRWKPSFLISRLLWIGFSLGLVYLSAFFFHRFDFKQRFAVKKKSLKKLRLSDKLIIKSSSINRNLFPPLVIDYGIFPFLKTEFLLLLRHGNKWLWLGNAALWMAMFFAPQTIAHVYLLPVLWFLQVTRWSELVTKEKTHRLDFFTYSSYKPLLRMLPAQVLAGFSLAVVLALPLILRYAVGLDFYPIINILNGSLFIVLLAVCLGITSGGKKLYEIVFFLLTYAVVNKIPAADYLGNITHDNPIGYITMLLGLNLSLALTSFIARNYQSRHL